MKAWQRQAEGWPLVESYTLDMDSAPEWLRSKSERQVSQKDLDLNWIGIKASLLWFVLPSFLAAVGILVIKHFGGSSIWMILPLLVIALSVLAGPKFGFGCSIKKLFLHRKRTLLEDLEAKGETTLGAEIVDVAYGEALWWTSGFDEDMDGGALRIDFDQLSFVGQHTRFGLPAGALVSTEIRRTNRDPKYGGFRLFLNWRDGNRTGTLSLKPTERKSPRQDAAEIVELQERIEAWRNEPRPLLGQRPFLVPPMLSELRPVVPKAVHYGLVAKLLASVVAFLTYVLLVGLLVLIPSGKTFIDQLFSAMSSVLLVGGIVFVFALPQIEKRLPLRYRYQEPEAVETLPSMGEVPPEETPSIQNRA